MASESSSAVLDLNDADATEDTDASITEGAHDDTPLIMEHGYDIAIKVDAPMKQLSTLETFVTYRVRCVCARFGTIRPVRRRYNHFKLLHKRLSRSHTLFAVPPLPPLHSARQQLDRYSPSFVAIRMIALHAFLNRVAKHPILTHSDDFRLFVTTPDDEFDKVFKSENSAMNLWGLSAALYSGSDTKSNSNGARVKDPEFTSAVDYLQSLQQKLTTLCSLTNKLYKGTAALGKEYSNMQCACSVWGAGERGGAGRAALGVSSGAARAAGCRRRAGSGPGEGGALATLPLLAAYCAAHVDKIRQRDNAHVAYVSGNNTTDDAHNRLEQASEALRSELSDWLPKTHSEIKQLLLHTADTQVNMHTQTLMAWEHALKLSTEQNIDDIFKTVSKTAVHNLSPSKYPEITTMETYRDLDELESTDSEKNQDFSENSDVKVNLVTSDNGFDSAVINKDCDSEKLDSNSINLSTNFDVNDETIVSDPLQSFSEVDLNS